MGRCVARNQANGMMARASNNKIQITRLIYLTLMPIQLAIWPWNNKASTKNNNDDIIIDKAEVPVTVALSSSLLKNLKKAVSMP